MDNNYFDFLMQNSSAEPLDSQPHGDDTVKLTVRVDADCQVVCDGDFLFLVNANQIVKETAPAGQHILQFVSIDFPDLFVEKIVDFDVPGKNYLIVVNELKSKIDENKSASKVSEEDTVKTEHINEQIEAPEIKHFYDIYIDPKTKYLKDTLDIVSITMAMNGELMESANSGDVEAAFVVARIYESDRFGFKNVPEAIKWMWCSADGGFAVAQQSIANRLATGDGVEKDPARAFSYYIKAASQNYASAFFGIGKSYYLGRGVDQNYDEAVRWFKKAAEQEVAIAHEFLGDCYYFGNGVEQNYDEAVRCYKKAAEQGDIDANLCLGYCYYSGKGIEQNYSEAVRLFKMVKECGGYRKYQYCLANCFYNGWGVEQNYDEAVRWYKKAAENGLPSAQASLGACYCYGHGVPQDRDEAEKWLDKATRQGDKYAKQLLFEKFSTIIVGC